ncbi:MAG: HDOD domain-containing protein [Azoarcus sp.]|nr:HDOD domain-containing protein [Azoarcus sp.]
MLTSLIRRLFHYSPPPQKSDTHDDTLIPGFDSVYADTLIPPPPLRQQPPQAGISSIEDIGASIICREAVLDRQQRIVGYQFLLQKTAHAAVRVKNRRFFHLCAEVLIRDLAHTNIFPMLGQRSIFIEIPDSFLEDPCLTQLPAANTCYIISPVKDSGAPTQSELLARVRTLRNLGYRVGIPDPLANPACFHLLPEIDLVSIQSSQVDIDKGENLIRFLFKKTPKASVLVRNLSSIEDFNFCHEIGATLFQGAFIVSREHWQRADLGSNVAYLGMLLKKLRQDADTREIVTALKQDAAITLRLLRYINSAANGLRENVSSVEHAITLLGREPLQRWLMLLLCSTNRNQPRVATVLETAIVRARFMELVSRSRPVAEREAIFLTGLLSLIDVILKQPIEYALETLSVADEIRDAILHSRGVYATTLALARACESMDTGRIVSAAEACAIFPEQASTCYMDALSWTLTLQQDTSD